LVGDSAEIVLPNNTLLLPVWVVYHTHAPRWSVSAFFIINTVMVVLFQVRVGRTVQTIRQGGAAFRRAGVIFLVSCSAMGLAAGLPAWARGSPRWSYSSSTSIGRINFSI